ncbi:30S ribosomal protein S5 [Blattabacterium cuenoti]|uniref:30S ribosomal protein S5 n=1 Tax=Blattabacterium cuenoti TaxID=1653831 RepID=UPI00163BF3BE|nr:30S ribosomal protein S5 [Blattabacterium cuenoti]
MKIEKKRKGKNIIGGIELKEKLIGVTRVCKVTKGRRYFSFSAIVIKGTKKGMVGYGFGKSKEAPDAIHKAGEKARKNLRKVCVFKGTIPHEQESRYGGAKVLIKPASDGTGIIAGGILRAVFEAAGFKNILSKSKGSSNPHNLIKAALKALSCLRDVQTIAKQRDISIQKVYSG